MRCGRSQAAAAGHELALTHCRRSPVRRLLRTGHQSGRGVRRHQAAGAERRRRLQRHGFRLRASAWAAASAGCPPAAAAGGTVLTRLACGQTGAGKTFTMYGDQGNEEMEGVTPRAIKELFAIVRIWRTSCPRSACGRVRAAIPLHGRPLTRAHRLRIRPSATVTPASSTSGSSATCWNCTATSWWTCCCRRNSTIAPSAGGGVVVHAAFRAGSRPRSAFTRTPKGWFMWRM